MPDEPPNTIEERLARLEQTVAQLARIVGMPAERAASRANSGFVEAPTPETYIPVPEQSTISAATARADAEGFFGGRVLLAGGAVTLLLGIAFFIKYAFDNGWIGPSGRVAIGMIAGIALVAAGQRFERTSTALFAGVLTGLGGGVLYLSLWAAGSDFHLVPIVVSFSAM